MWQETNSRRDPDRAVATPTIFDHAAGRIRQEVRDRTGLDPTQVMVLAAVQELEHEHQATLANPALEPAELEATAPDVPDARGFDDPQRREQLRTLVAAGVQTPVAAAPGPRPAAARSANRELRRWR
jgi:hypothetical protein